MKAKNVKFLLILFFLLFSTANIMTPVIGSPDLVTSRTYTLDADFDEGVLVGVEHDTIHDQLQLSEEDVTLPFIWVPNNEGTVSKVNTETGDEIGRYWVAPNPDRSPFYPAHTYYPNLLKSSSPSRTTVDLQGNCWVGNRDAGTVVKIGLYEAGIWDDRNKDKIIQTSMDLNGDGNIQNYIDPVTSEEKIELLAWGDDECVLFEVVLYDHSLVTKGNYTPGEYDGLYDKSHWRTSPRGLAIDGDNNLWAGTCPTDYYTSMSGVYHYINGDTGEIINEVPVPDHYAYGAVIDGNGILWSSNRPSGTPWRHILRLDPSDLSQEKISLNNKMSYGLALDHLDHLFASGWRHYVLSRVNINRPSGASFPYTEEYSRSIPGRDARGAACTSDNDVWVVSTWENKVYRFNNDATQDGWVGVGPSPTGVAVDAVGKVWVCSNGDDSIHRINPATNTVDKVVNIIGSGGHYSYSDMTGIVARTITTRIGTWTVDFDSGELDTPWGKISWNSFEPEGTEIKVKVRSSNDQITWSSWEEDVLNGGLLSLTPDGQYLQIETTLKTDEDELSPILYDLTATIGIIDATVDFNPNTLNQKSKGKWITVYIEFPEGFDVNDIDVSTVMLNDEIPAEIHPTGVGDKDVDGIPDRMVKFNRTAVIDFLENGEMVYITITGELIDGTPFTGTDVIRVIH